ncbi:MAG TPA: hypothetical protein VGK52_13720 [Polyangia bacterium]
MSARSPRVDFTSFAGVLALGAALLGPQAAARADESPPAAPPARAAAPRAAELKHAPPAPPAAPRPRRAETRTVDGCHPGEDLACTVIHETADGVIVMTFRPTNAKNAPNWSVVNEPAEGNAGSSGGTIYIVPSGGSRQLSSVTLSTNGAPIID